MKKAIRMIVALLMVAVMIPAGFALESPVESEQVSRAASSTMKYDSRGNAFKVTGNCQKSGTITTATTKFNVTNYSPGSNTLNGVQATCKVTKATVTLSNSTKNTNSNLIGSKVITCSDKVTSGFVNTGATFTVSVSGVICTHYFKTTSGVSGFTLTSTAP